MLIDGRQKAFNSMRKEPRLTSKCYGMVEAKISPIHVHYILIDSNMFIDAG